MSSSVWKTLFDQFADVMDHVREGNRKPKKVSNILKAIISDYEVHIYPMNPLGPISVTMGKHESAEDLIKDLFDRGYSVSPWARNIIEQPHFHIPSGKYRVSIIEVKGLGFAEKEVAIGKILNRVRCSDRINLAPPALAPYLRLNYEGYEGPFESHDSINIAHAPVEDGNENLCLLRIGRDYTPGKLFARSGASSRKLSHRAALAVV